MNSRKIYGKFPLHYKKKYLLIMEIAMFLTKKTKKKKKKYSGNFAAKNSVNLRKYFEQCRQGNC